MATMCEKGPKKLIDVVGTRTRSRIARDVSLSEEISGTIASNLRAVCEIATACLA